MIVSQIVAIGKHRQIGKENKLLWHIPEDFKLFKETTLGHHLLMGRKTFESIGKPLPKRTTIVITHDLTYKVPDGCFVVHSIEDGIELARTRGESELFICGGAMIYQESLPLSNRLYISYVDYDGEADAFYPEIDLNEWIENAQKEFCNWKRILFVRG